MKKIRYISKYFMAACSLSLFLNLLSPFIAAYPVIADDTVEAVLVTPTPTPEVKPSPTPTPTPEVKPSPTPEPSPTNPVVSPTPEILKVLSVSDTLFPPKSECVDKIQICHATSSSDNPYNLLDLSCNAVYSPGNGGHLEENGTPKSGHEDDVPALYNSDLDTYYCPGDVLPTPTPSVSPTPVVTPTVTPSIIPTVVPSVTPTVTPSVSPTPIVTPSVTPTPDVCVEEFGYPLTASKVDDFDNKVGKTKDGSNVESARENPENAQGNPDSSFLSLGVNGQWVFEHKNGVIKNVPGYDLSFHEITNGRSTYPLEVLKVEVSQNGKDWVSIGEVTNKSTNGGEGVGYLELPEFWTWAKYVKVIDTTDYDLHRGNADGYDLDAIDVKETGCGEYEEEEIPEESTDVLVCKYDENKKPLSGWVVSLLSDKVDSINVNPETGETSTTQTLSKDNYVLVSGGSYEYRGDTGFITDATFSERKESDGHTGPYFPFINVMQLNPTGVLGLMVNNTSLSWSNYYNPDHEYHLYYPNYEGQFEFKVFDSNYSDNKGSLSVDIYKGYSGITDGSGCYLAEGVEYGEYEVREVLSQGYENISGLGNVTINEDTKEISVVNRKISVPGSIKVTKQVDWLQALPNTDKEFEICINSDSLEDEVCKVAPYNGGDILFDSLEEGEYTVIETNPGEMWQVEISAGTVIVEDNKQEEVTITNTLNPVTVYASKIFCSEEQYLPNWGLSNQNTPAVIDQNTAINFVENSNGNCWFMEDSWDFQWGYDSKDDVLGVNKLPGTHIGLADGTPSSCGFGCGNNTNSGTNYNEWKLFDSSSSFTTPAKIQVTDLQGAKSLWVREVLKDDYLPFTYPPQFPRENTISAELYCHTDIDNFDNYDRVDNVSYGNSYYCVAFNTPAYDIHGFKFNDLNNNGDFDDEENKLSGWTIFIDENGNKVLDSGEILTTTSDKEGEEFGWYWFENLPAGTYSICEVQQQGWNQTYPQDNSCHTVSVPYGEGLEFTRNAVFAPEYNFGNYQVIEEPQLTIEKTNNVNNGAIISERGGIVEYTLIVTAEGGNVDNVVVTDLPPLGFEVQNQANWQATSSVRGTFNVPNPNYASPGDWQIGNLQQGEVVYITYSAKIDKNINPGLYKDLAYAQGINPQNEDNILAQSGTQGFIDNNYVGTAARVNVEPNSPNARADIDEEEIEEEIEEEGSVLGTSTSLPATGSPTFMLLLLLILFGVGLTFIFMGKSNNKVKSVVITMFITLNFVVLSSNVSAAGLSVRLDEPKTPTNTEFNLSFVAMDIQQRLVEAKCLVQKPGSASYVEFETKSLIAGGTSNSCAVTKSNVLSSEGNYNFKVVVSANGDNAEDTVSVKYDGSNPGKPKDLEVDRKNNCKYEIKFKTANDNGQTSYVEIYRDNSTDFTVNANTRIASVSANSNEKVEYTDNLAGSQCGERQYYAIRAFDSAGNASSVVAEEVVTIKTITTTSSSSSSSTTGTTSEEDQAIQAISIGTGGATTISTGTGNQDAEVSLEEDQQEDSGEIQGDESTEESEQQVEDGEVKGAEDTNRNIWLIVLGALGIIAVLSIIISFVKGKA